MTLRTRLLLGLVAIVLAGLFVSDVVTYKSLESFLVSRLDQQLENSPTQAARALNQCQPGTQSCSSFDIPSVPPGTFAEIRFPNGSLSISGWFLLSNPQLPHAPKFPAKFPLTQSGNDPQIFTVSNSTGLVFNAIAVPLRFPNSLNPLNGLTVIVAVPLTQVDQTLNHLLLIELLVSACVLLLLGALVWWIVRRGLRPLDQMATTAGAIAAGDLTQRVEAGDARTEVGRLGEALNYMLGEIEVAFAARTASEERLRRFLADASHELRTPLTSIRGYAEMFDRGARDRPEDLAMSMRHIRADADRMSTLVDDLVLIARLGRERPLAHEQVDLHDVLEPAVAAIRVQAPDRNVTLSGSESATVVGDANRLRQVVDNLLVNALRYTPSGSPIDVRLSEEEGSALIAVVDEGAGIPPSEREHIFEPFHRLDPSRTRATGGQGLGLAIVATIVRAHGGEVGVDGGENGGAKFWVRLPLTLTATTTNGRSPSDGHANVSAPSNTPQTATSEVTSVPRV
ncbi:MAG: HAMP domain-containing sensor histidine kinase [Acidimicrobiales bacterium]